MPSFEHLTEASAPLAVVAELSTTLAEFTEWFGVRFRRDSDDLGPFEVAVLFVEGEEYALEHYLHSPGSGTTLWGPRHLPELVAAVRFTLAFGLPAPVWYPPPARDTEVRSALVERVRRLRDGEAVILPERTTIRQADEGFVIEGKCLVSQGEDDDLPATTVDLALAFERLASRVQLPTLLQVQGWASRATPSCNRRSRRQRIGGFAWRHRKRGGRR